MYIRDQFVYGRKQNSSAAQLQSMSTSGPLQHQGLVAEQERRATLLFKSKHKFWLHNGETCEAEVTVLCQKENSILQSEFSLYSPLTTKQLP